MALILHKVLQDGSIVHEDFSKESWERAMHDASLLRFWGHPPGDEKDPVGAHWAKLRREGYPCGPKQHEFADREDPAWVGSRGIELVEPPKVAPPPPRPSSRGAGSSRRQPSRPRPTTDGTPRGTPPSCARPATPTTPAPPPPATPNVKSSVRISLRRFRRSTHER